MIRSPLEFRHLQTLVALRDTGNLSRAAQFLCLTQSALSHQLKALEAHFGLPLFVRKSAPLTFTPAGKRLLALAEQVVPAIEETERDIARLAQGTGGTLRIAVECHTCFDWLMPAMDAFRQRWPEVELDIVSGFHADPVGLLHQDRADLAIVAEADPAEAVDYHPLFRFQIVGLVGNTHPLAAKPTLCADDFRAETLITYPVPDEMLDIMRQVLVPAGIAPKRRTSELTVAILQLVASRRGVAALPLWAVATYLDKHYVSARQVLRGDGTTLSGELYAATLPAFSSRPYAADFVSTMRATCAVALPEIELM
ncbi:LysR family transcriptional regulator [Burkholderia ubonensis]|uniref:LysR family transcriptional regulator n=1 Tax=Burkholderia ubonensis TaxID=101571 RepID=UPI000754BD95|nr:LysR family transcriptional regulator [Burkholderia ubonensis]KVO03674.1 LysR family transcriptional regulator [Burkholderia ubonensis]KVO09922.1 LysR family transcriptional regulator [Burkholderia ubonensis]